MPKILALAFQLAVSSPYTTTERDHGGNMAKTADHTPGRVWGATRVNGTRHR
jgi:hypothetical protein